MEQNAQLVQIKDSIANPAPLGLLGFGLTTTLLNLHNAGFFALDSMILGMGIFVGGIAQIFAGIMESKKGNTFATTAFCAYGSFWIALVALLVLPKMGLATAATPVSMGFFLSLWGLFSFGMFLCTFKINKGLQVVFGLLVILFALLAIGDFTGNHTIKTIAGYEGILCGLSAIYMSLAQIANEVYGREICPIGHVK